LQKLGKAWQSINKKHRSLKERFNLKKLNELEATEHYQIKISKRFAALENLGDSEDMNRAWKNIEEDIKTSAKESLGLHKLKQYRTRFDEECLSFLKIK
jgi:glycine betaine/choline ABC-type transport system substrate-binding protein